MAVGTWRYRCLAGTAALRMGAGRLRSGRGNGAAARGRIQDDHPPGSVRR